MKYSTTFRVRTTYECGPDGSVLHATLVRMALQVGYLVTRAYRLDELMAAQQTTFVIRKLQFEAEALTQGDEELVATTWLSDVRRFRGLREVTFAGANGQVVARVSLDWVYVRRSDFAPVRFQPQLMEQLGDTAERACTKVFETVESQTLPPTPPTVVLHVVRPYEIDINNHVNTACYFEWLQSAWSDMSGQMPNKLSAYRLEFLRSAQWRDAVTIETQAAGPNVWRQAIKNTNGEILVTNVCVSNCP